MHGFRKLLLNDWLKGADTYEIQQCHQKSVQNLTFVCLAFNFVNASLHKAFKGAECTIKLMTVTSHIMKTLQ